MQNIKKYKNKTTIQKNQRSESKIPTRYGTFIVCILKLKTPNFGVNFFKTVAILWKN